MTPYSYPGLIDNPSVIHDTIKKVQSLPQFKDVTASEILGKNRKYEIVMARHVFRFLLYCKIRNYLRIAQLTKCDHVTVMHSVSAIEDFRLTNPKLYACILALV
jgi:chromosomal replication initiation ATPase DnaA